MTVLPSGDVDLSAIPVAKAVMGINSKVTKNVVVIIFKIAFSILSVQLVVDRFTRAHKLVI